MYIYLGLINDWQDEANQSINQFGINVTGQLMPFIKENTLGYKHMLAYYDAISSLVTLA